MVGVSLQGVSKSYGETPAVRDVSFEVREGELFFLLGPSGCGKTTLLRMIAGFVQPDGGAIYFDQRLIGPVPAHRRNTGMVFQSYALWPHMSVAQNVAYGLRERRVGRAERESRVSRALETVRMLEYRERMPNQLSGGQQQRVALARALVIEPDVVLLDEPLSNLDAKLRLEMRHEIRRIHGETGITMLYVTHDQKEALSMAQRMAVMSMGRVEQVGDPRALYRRPANRFVAEFIGEANMLDGVLVSHDGARATVDTALGRLSGVFGEQTVQAGRRVSLMVRPECLNLQPGAENNLRATVSESVYLGESEQFVLTVGDLELRAVESDPGPSAPTPGQEVEAHFSPQDAVILPLED
ncbi:MAG: ABC transporter ATP-binding protein [Planctomycetes bacterium]|nr:ABC transporter ATP-binding protein [Planctomycetota bacterium]